MAKSSAGVEEGQSTCLFTEVLHTLPVLQVADPFPRAWLDVLGDLRSPYVWLGAIG